MAYFKKVVKDTVFEKLKNDKNLMVTVAIPEGLAERATCSLKRKDLNNKIYTVSIDNKVNTVLEIPFLDLYSYNRSLLQMGSIIMLEDTTGEDTAIRWLIDNLNLNSLYEIISAIFGSIEEGYSVESIQNVIDSIVENRNLSDHQLFTVKNLINYGIIARCPIGVVGDLIIVLNDLFENSSWSERTSTRLFK